MALYFFYLSHLCEGSTWFFSCWFNFHQYHISDVPWKGFNRDQRKSRNL